MVEIFEEGKSVVVYGNLDVEKTKRVIVDHVVNGKPVSEYAIEAG
jgi:(2Fe-2S) ferredoxin